MASMDYFIISAHWKVCIVEPVRKYLAGCKSHRWHLVEVIGGAKGTFFVLRACCCKLFWSMRVAVHLNVRNVFWQCSIRCRWEIIGNKLKEDDESMLLRAEE